MKKSVILTIASMLMILLSSLHLADDIARGFEKGGPSDLIVVPMTVILLYGTLVLAAPTKCHPNRAAGVADRPAAPADAS